MRQEGHQDEQQLRTPANRRCKEQVGQDQENNTHCERMKMSFLDKGVEVFWKEQLPLNLPAQIVCDDPLVTEADAHELKYPIRCQASQNEKEK